MRKLEILGEDFCRIAPKISHKCQLVHWRKPSPNTYMSEGGGYVFKGVEEGNRKGEVIEREERKGGRGKNKEGG